MEQAGLGEGFTDITLLLDENRMKSGESYLIFLESEKCNITDIMGKVIHYAIAQQ